MIAEIPVLNIKICDRPPIPFENQPVARLTAARNPLRRFRSHRAMTTFLVVTDLPVVSLSVYTPL